MNNFLKKIKRAPWVFGQPLTNKPDNPKSVISDLFVWRCNRDWNTYFELLDIASLFGDDEQHQVDIVFFNEVGSEFYRKSIELDGLCRQTLNITNILSTLDKLPSDYGAFAVFHQQTPSGVSENGSFIAERGYVSYQYKGLPLRSYVHGNLDAIDDMLMPLGGSSFFNRQYNLQCLLEANKSYEVALVNASPSNKKVMFEVVSFSGKTQIKKNVILNPMQAFVLPITNLPSHSRLIIESKMIMARPIVFCYNKNRLNVFHG
jgi:hypothetical protein